MDPQVCAKLCDLCPSTLNDALNKTSMFWDSRETEAQKAWMVQDWEQSPLILNLPRYQPQQPPPQPPPQTLGSIRT